MMSSTKPGHLALLLSGGAVLLLLLLGVTHHHQNLHHYYTSSSRYLGGRTLLYSGGNALYWDNHEQYTNLQLSRDIDPSIEARAHDQDQHWLSDNDGGGRTKENGGKCSRLFLYLPDMFSKHGHGSQIQLYITGVVASTYLDRAMLVVDPPIGQDINFYEGGSQFGCPVDAFFPSSSSDNTHNNLLVLRENFPTGLSRLIHQPTWLARGCELPTTCNGKAVVYDDWIRLARKQPRTLGNRKKLQFNELSCTNDDGSITNVIVTGGRSLRLYYTMARAVMTSSSASQQQTRAKQRWAINLGASPIEANRFANIVDTTKVWDYVLGLLNRSGFVKFQPWIARDVEALLQSYDIPRTLGTTYTAIHVRRGDKLTEEARDEVIKFWSSQGHNDRNNLPTDYVPFRQYLAQWDGPELCPIDTTTGQQQQQHLIVKYNVYIATDDPTVVLSEIESMPERIGSNVILWNTCHELTFYFNPTTNAAVENAFHLNGNGEEGFHDEGVVDTCHQRYHRNIVSIVDMFILCRAHIFIGEYNSNWGRVIREMRVRLSGNNDLSHDATDLAYTLDTRVAWGSDKPLIPGI